METERWAGSVGCGIVRGWAGRAIKSGVWERRKEGRKEGRKKEKEKKRVIIK